MGNSAAAADSNDTALNYKAPRVVFSSDLFM